MRRLLKWFGDTLADLLYPPRCLACNKALDHKEYRHDYNGRHAIMFCRACRQKIAAPRKKICLYCGGSLFTQGERPERCISCEQTTFPFRRVIALGPYCEPLRSLLLQAKHRTGGEIPWSLARLTTLLRRDDFANLEIDLVVPVPMHFLRRLLRGINSPEVMAAWYAKSLGVPCRSNLLQRHRATRRQSSLPGPKRRTNVAGAFALRPRSRFLRRPLDIAGKRILLVDDIFTTGATCTEIAKLLLSAGAKEITVVTIARAEGKDIPRSG
ncbi:MAG: phosphoribosyltransferase family protein [Planctomycetia bacterium]|nr:phosphoribosyltransferase family protein [Planctomycetia bacterium]